MTPVMRPPSRFETDAWLEEEEGLQGLRAPQIRQQAGGSEKAGQGSGFAMDANTGKLIPVSADVSQVRCSPCTPHTCMGESFDLPNSLFSGLDVAGALGTPLQSIHIVYFRGLHFAEQQVLEQAALVNLAQLLAINK